MRSVRHTAVGVGLGDRKIATLIPRDAELPVRRQSTRPARDYYHEPARKPRHTAFRIPIVQGQGRHEVSLGTLEIVSPLQDPGSCRVVLRLGRTGLLRVTATIGDQEKTVPIHLGVGRPRRRRGPALAPVGSLRLDHASVPFPPPRVRSAG
ncbi:MAG: hypothetical protein Q7R80_00695 [bacterium]|nr:hypothetical protein [bacterium]